MKTRNLGVAIITIGILMIILTGFNYVTIERAVDGKLIKINIDKNQSIQWWMPLLGVVLIGGGGTIVVHHEKKIT